MGSWQRFLAPYYWATPLFFLLDVGWGVNVRVAGLDGHPALRYAYYAICLGCALLIRLVPRGTVAVALTESTVNLLLLVAGFASTYAGALGALAAGRSVRNPFAVAWFVNFLLAATTGLVAYHRAELRLLRDQSLATRRPRR